MASPILLGLVASCKCLQKFNKFKEKQKVSLAIDSLRTTPSQKMFFKLWFKLNKYLSTKKQKRKKRKALLLTQENNSIYTLEEHFFGTH